MFLLNGKRLPEGVAFEDAEGNKYPPQWLNQTTIEQKNAIGITEVADPILVDTRFYWDANLPKALEDREESDKDGNPLYEKELDLTDPENPVMVNTTKRLVTKGLKTQFIEQIKQTANSLLTPTDWMIVRKYERDIDVPADVVTYRTDVVANQARLESAIIAVNTVEDLIAVLNSQDWPKLEGAL